MVVTYDAGTSIINVYHNGTAIGIAGVAGTTGYVIGLYNAAVLIRR